MIISLVLLAGFLTVPALSKKTSSFFKASVAVTKNRLKLGEATLVFLYIKNNAPFEVYGFRGVREGLGNALEVESIYWDITVNGHSVGTWASGIPRTESITHSITFEPPTVTRTITATFAPWTGRWSPIVLPGETVAVYYGGWIVGCEEEAGVYEWIFTVHAKFQGSPIVLTESGKFKVENTYPPCALGGVLTSVTGVPVVGANITLTDLTTSTTVATTSTNSYGVFFFDAATVGLITGHSYRVSITELPPPFTTVAPASSSFTWTGSSVGIEPWPFWAS